MTQMTAQTLTGDVLLGQLRELLPGLGERYHVVNLAVFGSRVRTDATSDSDLDLLVDFDSEASLFDLVGMELDLQERLGMKVDVLTRASIKPRFRERILESAVPVGRGRRISASTWTTSSKTCGSPVNPPAAWGPLPSWPQLERRCTR